MIPSEYEEVSRLERADQLGLAGFRTPITLNAGAILAMITYVGGSSQDSRIVLDVDALKCTIVLFLIAIIAILVALLISYSYTDSQPDSKMSLFFNEWIIATNAALAIICIALFAIGVGTLVTGMSAR